MNAVRRSDGVLSREATLKLLRLLEAGGKPVAQLARELFALVSASPARTFNSVQILCETGVLIQSDGTVTLSPDAAAAAEISTFVRDAILGRYLSFLSTAELGSTFQLGDGPEDVRIDSVRLPLRDHGYPYLLLEFGVALRSVASDRFWRVSPEATGAVLRMLSLVSQQPPRTKQFSLEALKQLQAAQEKAGAEAEDFVVNLERTRLSRHPFVGSIRRISDDDSAAGFDILSFDAERNLGHDRFIEVKSYGSEESFYWSAGEVAAAQRYGNFYWLYLVDRRRMGQQGYEPEMLQDPYTYFMIHRPANWLAEPQSLKFTRTDLIPNAGGPLPQLSEA